MKKTINYFCAIIAMAAKLVAIPLWLYLPIYAAKKYGYNYLSGLKYEIRCMLRTFPQDWREFIR